MKPLVLGGILRRLLAVAMPMVATAGAAEDYDALNDGVVKVISTSPDGMRRTGTGFIVKLESDAAYIVTANHVVEGDKQPSVTFSARRNVSVAAENIRGDARLDAALLIVRGRDNLPQGVRALPLEAEQNLKRGDDVTTIGFPAGLGDWAVTKSTIASQEGFDLTLSGGIAEGSSGGPVLREGRVVAMVSAVQGIAGRATPALILRYALKGWGVDLATGVPTPLPAPTTTPTPVVLPAAATAGVGQPFKDCADCPELVVVPAGRFSMGSTDADRNPNEGPSHEVTLARALAVGKYEVTRGQFARFVTDAKWDTSGGCWVWDDKEEADKRVFAKSWRDPGFAQGDQHPVVCVSHADAKAYVEWLSGKTGKAYRLLSEAEWEYAARAGSTALRFWGEAENAACTFANVADFTTKGRHPSFTWPTFDCEDGYAETAPVGRYKPNAWGLYDVLGNAREWVEDCYHGSYDGAPADGSAWLSGGCEFRVDRGGGWLNPSWSVHSADRFMLSPDSRVHSVGFRVARTLP